MGIFVKLKAKKLTLIAAPRRSRIKSSHLLGLFFLAALALASCKRDKITPSQTPEPMATATDSASLEKEEELIEIPSSIASVEDARIVMEKGPDASKYKEGILLRMLDEVPAYALRVLKEQKGGFIVVDKFRMLVILYDQFGRERKSYSCACGKNFGNKHSKGDCRTPEGFFIAQGIFDSTNWLYTDDKGYTSPIKGQFGPRYLRLTNAVGIHGTCAPWSIGKRCSHGCIRITNENILELVELVDPNIPIIVSPGRRDMGVNEAEGFTVPAVTTGSERPTAIKVSLPKKDPAEEEEIVEELSETETPLIEPQQIDTI